MSSVTCESLPPEFRAVLANPDLIDRELARRSLDDFARRMLNLEPARHHEFVNGKLEAVERGEILRLMLFEPPGHAKSTYASHLFPGWYLGRNPERSVIAASHTAQLATRFGRKVRNLFAAPDWPFGDVALAGDSRAADQWETTDSGEYFAVGVGGGRHRPPRRPGHHRRSDQGPEGRR